MPGKPTNSCFLDTLILTLPNRFSRIALRAVLCLANAPTEHETTGSIGACFLPAVDPSFPMTLTSIYFFPLKLRIRRNLSIASFEPAIANPWPFMWPRFTELVHEVIMFRLCLQLVSNVGARRDHFKEPTPVVFIFRFSNVFQEHTFTECY